MSHRAHALLGIAVEVLGFLSGFFLCLRFLGNPVGPVAWIPWFLALSVSTIIPRLVYRRLIPARCVKCAAVRAYLLGTNPWRYECRACEHIHHTSVSDSGATPTVWEEAEEESDK